MAIYRTGSAALSAEGKATGTGTSWTTPLSLIRVGATVMFLSGSKPVLGTISEIVSDTEMNLTATGGDTASDGDYAILIHDSLTVEGLAQDVAEALRYYQGSESELADLQSNIQAYLKSAQDSATAAKTSETNAAGSASAAENSAKAAANSQAAAKTSETNAGGSASAADSSAKAASNSQTAAKTSETNAAGSATASANSAAAAKTSEQNAASTLSGAVKKAGDTMTGELTIDQSSASGGKVIAGGGRLELYASTPFIDFHYANSTADYTARIIHTEAQALEVSAANGGVSFRINGGLRVGGASFSGGINIYRGNGDANALWGINVSDGNFNFIRGGSAGENMSLGDSYLSQVRGIYCKRGSSGVYGANKYHYFWTGSQMEVWVDTNAVGAIQLASLSDRELKKDIEYLSDLSADYKDKALKEVIKWSPATFRYKARGILNESREMLGYIANDVVKVSSECVYGEGLVPGDWDESNPEGAYSLDNVAMNAKHTLAIQALYEIIEKLTSRVAELESKQ